MNRKIRIGMVGGGKDAFIGSVHRIAFRLDGYYELVAGSFSSDFDNSKETGKNLGLDQDFFQFLLNYQSQMKMIPQLIHNTHQV